MTLESFSPPVPSAYSLHFGKLTNSSQQFLEDTFSLVNFPLELDSSNQQTLFVCKLCSMWHNFEKQQHYLFLSNAEILTFTLGMVLHSLCT